MRERLIKTVDSIVKERWYVKRIETSTNPKCAYPATHRIQDVAITKYYGFDSLLLQETDN